MRLWERIAPIVVPLLIVIAVTEVLYFFKGAVHAHHLVFFYLLPTAFIAMLYGSVLSMICAIDATLVADFFLYDPGYTLYVSDPRQAGELFLFGLSIDRSEVYGGNNATSGETLLNLQLINNDQIGVSHETGQIALATFGSNPHA
jgi:hypothetical protein